MSVVAELRRLVLVHDCVDSCTGPRRGRPTLVKPKTSPPSAASIPDLSDRHELALALFKYGLVSTPAELAMVMQIDEEAAAALCDDLAATGLLSPEDDGSPGSAARPLPVRSQPVPRARGRS